LQARTERFSRTPRTVEAILHFSEKTRSEEQIRQLDPDLYSCDFIGFLDSSGTRVGCLLNPLARGNCGIDWRGLSFHGGSACQGFFCRSFREITGAQKEVFLGTISDGYLYGLVVSDVDYIKIFSASLRRDCGQPSMPQGFLPLRLLCLSIDSSNGKSTGPSEDR
jgi:hypothetical protein